jgi:hypothetical protein
MVWVAAGHQAGLGQFVAGQAGDIVRIEIRLEVWKCLAYQQWLISSGFFCQ